MSLAPWAGETRSSSPAAGMESSCASSAMHQRPKRLHSPLTQRGAFDDQQDPAARRRARYVCMSAWVKSSWVCALSAVTFSRW